MSFPAESACSGSLRQHRVACARNKRQHRVAFARNRERERERQRQRQRQRQRDRETERDRERGRVCVVNCSNNRNSRLFRAINYCPCTTDCRRNTAHESTSQSTLECVTLLQLLLTLEEPQSSQNSRHSYMNIYSYCYGLVVKEFVS